MDHLNAPGHVYLREIDPTVRTSLSVIAGLIAPGSTVLDLGTGSGALGDFLTNQKRCQVDGVTYNAQEASLASLCYRKVQVADLETCNLEALWGTGQYDYIVCADVLEHVRCPERILYACRQLLVPNGRLIISIPNASYSGLIGELMAGDFQYRDEGLLDRTHVKFFTRKSLLKFVENAGWYPYALEVIEREVIESEFRQDFDRLPPAVARYLFTLPDSMAYQLVFVATLTDTDKVCSDKLKPDAHMARRATFSAQLYLGTAGQYSEDRKVIQAGTIGAIKQTLTFNLPESGERTERLRFDPADRPGYLHLYSMALRDRRNSAVWSWSFAVDGLGIMQSAELHQLSFHPGAFSESYALALLLGDDPWIELPLEKVLGDAALDLSGGVLEVEMGWPMSADYQILSEALEPLRRHSHALETEVAKLRQQLSLVQRLDVVQVSPESASPKVSGHAQYRGLFGLAKTWLHHQRFAMRAGAMKKGDQADAPNLPPCVDVIVPVFAGLDDTRRCIESVLCSLCLTRYRLIIINDASPDQSITEWLTQLQRLEPRVLLIENTENLGFVASVNLGMSLSQDNDVVLLNSDTEVANNWLDRLRNSAYDNGRVGTVTPFSNNATICSYPKFCQNNPLPAIGTKALDRLFAECNASQVVDVPTGVGFCMYIRRDCLREVGMFDVKNFGRGYGEENDFCVRAAKFGWRNLHALDVFVHHSGGVSFGESKRERELLAMETLRRLHPEYESAVRKFLNDDPARLSRERVNRARIANSALPVILLVQHNRGGGTERHVRELVKEMRGQAMFLSLMPVDVGQLRLHLLGDFEDFQLRFDAATGFEDLVYTLQCMRVDHLHFHHLIDLNDDIPTLPARLGITYDFTAHDFYSYCPQVNLTDHNHRYCGEEGLSQCIACLKETPTVAGTDIQAWRQRFHAFLMGARYVFAPSQDTAGRIFSAFPGVPVLAVPHTDLDGFSNLPLHKPAPLRVGKPLRVAVLGALSDIKGAHVLAGVSIAASQPHSRLEFHLLGYVANEFVFPPNAKLTVHGRYEDTELLPKLRQLAPDLIWFPAQWPETYSYTLSAALQSGLPIVAPDFGAFSERLTGRDWTWLRAWDDSVEQWQTFFEEIKQTHFATGTAPECAVSHQSGFSRVQHQRWYYLKHYMQGIVRRG